MTQYYLTLVTGSHCGLLSFERNSSLMLGLTPRKVVPGDGEFPKMQATAKCLLSVWKVPSKMRACPVRRSDYS